MTGFRILHVVKVVFNRHAVQHNNEGKRCILGKKYVVSRWQASPWTSDIIKKCFQTFNEKLTILSVLFARQCRAIAAQRLRRTIQTVDWYSRLYGEQSVWKVFVKIGGHILQGVLPNNGRRFYMLLGAVLFSWQKESITDDEIHSCIDDMDHIKELQDKNVVSETSGAYMEKWERIISGPHLQLWRQPIPNSSLYQYKVYGTYFDIPARSFFNVQVDLEYRKQWDKLVIELDVIDRDEESGSEVVHWITHYPFPMYSRDYVYIRRHQIDLDNNTMVVSSRAVEHPACPPLDDYVRVDTYNSQMVIKPHSSMDANGFDYVLTYYDNPQSTIPSCAYSWLASTGVPNFVDQLHNAAKKLHEKSRTHRAAEHTADANANRNRVLLNYS